LVEHIPLRGLSELDGRSVYTEGCLLSNEIHKAI
jgi:hypothetical protein